MSWPFLLKLLNINNLIYADNKTRVWQYYISHGQNILTFIYGFCKYVHGKYLFKFVKKCNEQIHFHSKSIRG